MRRPSTRALAVAVGAVLVVVVVTVGLVLRARSHDDGVTAADRAVAAHQREQRDPFLWPFASDSPWNTPTGGGARFAGTDDPRTQAVLDTSVKSWVNAGSYSHPVYRATDGDPEVRLLDEGRSNAEVDYRVPADAQPANGTDHHLLVVDPTAHFVDEAWNVRRDGKGLLAGYHARTDIRGEGITDGVRAYGGSAFGGLIRGWELNAGDIRHALALALTDGQLQAGPVWPATHQDTNGGDTYRGAVPMGTLLAIPPNVDLSRLKLSKSGLAVATALQRYGAYVVDRSDAFVLYAEPSLETSHQLAQVRRDLAKIRAELRVVDNNGPDQVGGGGRPLADPAPPLQP